MAEERTLGLAPAQTTEQEESVEELQRRLELTRNSISHTMSEIKETVSNQVQAVKDTFDWREQFKKRPIAWSAGALGVGFVTGYKIAGTFKHDSESERISPNQYQYTPQQRINDENLKGGYSLSPEDRDQQPGIIHRFKETPVYGSLRKEASSLGDQLVGELSSMAKVIVLPFLLSKFKEMVGLDRMEQSIPKTGARTSPKRTDWSEPERSTRPESTLGHS
jgi:hypothetical protein